MAGTSRKMYQLLGKDVRGRFGFPSGIIATNADTARRVIENIPQLGWYVGKSTTLEPKLGNTEDILVQPNKDSLRNAVGYTNPGLEATVDEFSRLTELADDVFIMPQIGESTEANFEECIARMDHLDVDGFELNISCPHADKGGILIGSDPDSAYSMVRAARKRTHKPLVVKLNAGVPDIGSIVKACESAGANAFSLINTLGGSDPELSNRFGGLSGASIYPVTLDTARYVRSITDKPMIVMGGIRGRKQLAELQSIDDNFFFGIGSALSGLDSPELKAYFDRLEDDLKQGKDFAESMTLNRNLMHYEPFIVKDVERLSESLHLIRFYENIDARPGQFVFVKTAQGSKPFSVANDKDNLELVVRNVGPVSESICSLKPNSSVRIRGPYGKDFTFDKDDKVAFVGAGCGIAPVYHAATHHTGEKIFMLGAKNRDELVYLQDFMDMGPTYIATEDGSSGYEGLITDMMPEVLGAPGDKGYKFFNCGPEKALRRIGWTERQYAKQKDIYHLIERITSCGIGICGKCSTPDGERACVDGPVFDAGRFTPGVYTRDKTGKKVRL